MEHERPDDQGADNRTVPVFGGPGPVPAGLGPDASPATSNETEARPPVPGRTEGPARRAGIATAIEPGAVLLGKYRVISKVGEGGMGSVWLVQHLGLDERRALKVISEGIAGDSHARARFDQEARILAKLKHANAVTVHDTGIVGDSAYIEMEYVEGVTLRRLLTRGEPGEPSFILWVMRGICDVLNTAHNRGIVHRDLKPENVMVVTDPETGREAVKVLDFGIAKIIQGADDGSASTMHTMGVLGTPAYSSPEQNAVEIDGSRRVPVDHRSDLYSLGVMLYELLTGDVPFKGAWAQVLYQHARVAPEPPGRVAPQAAIPPDVEKLVLRCLEKTPDLRPGSAAELYNELRAAYGEVGSAELEPTHEPRPRRSALPLLTPHPNADLETTLRDAGPPPARPWPKARRVLVPLALAAACLPAAWLLRPRPAKEVGPPPPPPPPSAEVSPEVVKYLAQHYGRRAYRPDPAAETVEIEGRRWPSAIVREDDGRRKLRLHDLVYLPEGAEPATSEGAEGAMRLPRVVNNTVLKRPIPFRLIEGGTFEMGDDAPELEGGSEGPSHEVSLHPYYIQEKETTIGQVDQFCFDAGRPPDIPELVEYRAAKGDLGMPVEEDLDDFPAVSLPRAFCETYARHLGGDLPTEAQWEFAARSRGARKRYVWEGERFDQGDANVLSLEPRVVKSHRVGSFPKDRTLQGVYDLAGNVREWCRDVWKPYSREFAREPLATSPDSDPDYAIRGGSFDTPTETARTTYRSNTPGIEYRAKDRASFPDVGFRVVLEVVVAGPLDPAPSRSESLAKEDPGR